jgi:hypothetical protein
MDRQPVAVIVMDAATRELYHAHVWSCTKASIKQALTKSRVLEACLTVARVSAYTDTLDALIAATHIEKDSYRRIAILTALGNMQYAVDVL